MTTPSVEDFGEWLEGVHPRVARFRDFLLPVGIRRDYSRESLVELEQLFLHRWPDRDSFKADDDTDFIDGAIRYIGETYLRAYGGGWHYTDDPKSPLAGVPFLRLDTVEPVPIPPLYLITALLSRRTGQELAKVYDGQASERRAAEAIRGTRAGRRPDPARESWVAGIEERLAAVRAEAEPLDLSPDSLDALEERVLQHFPDSDSLWVPEAAARFERYVCFLGEALRRQAGGQWTIQGGVATTGNTRLGRPLLTRKDSDGDEVVGRPYGTIAALVQTRRRGTLRKALASYSG